MSFYIYYCYTRKIVEHSKVYLLKYCTSALRFYASMPVTALTGGLVFSSCPSHFCECDLRNVYNFFWISSNLAHVHMDSMMSWLDLGSQRSKALWHHTCPIPVYTIFQECLEGISLHLTQASTWIHGWTDENVESDMSVTLFTALHLSNNLCVSLLFRLRLLIQNIIIIIIISIDEDRFIVYPVININWRPLIPSATSQWWTQ